MVPALHCQTCLPPVVPAGELNTLVAVYCAPSATDVRVGSVCSQNLLLSLLDQLK
jgi:hypothetical protein